MTEPAGHERSLAERWRGLRPGARRLVAGAGVVLAANLALAGAEAVTGGRGPAGPPSSSYATAPRGLAAYADLLAARGHPVRRLRTSVDEADLDPRTTLVVADAPDLTADETEAVARFVRDGGRLVVTGTGARHVVRAVAQGELAWSPRPATPATPLVPVPEVDGVRSVRSAGRGSWASTGPALPVLARGDAALAAVASVGQGRVVALADASPWQNRLLADADNAAFGLAAVGDPGRAVSFAEAHHGFGEGQGLGALPPRWRWALVIGATAIVLYLWSRGRRLGPPEESERPLPPPRRAYVDAMAAALAKTRQPAESMAPLQSAARRRLARRAGLPVDAGVEDVRLAAARRGLPADELDALVVPVTDDQAVMAAGRALARLEAGER